MKTPICLPAASAKPLQALKNVSRLVSCRNATSFRSGSTSVARSGISAMAEGEGVVIEVITVPEERARTQIGDGAQQHRDADQCLCTQIHWI